MKRSLTSLTAGVVLSAVLYSGAAVAQEKMIRIPFLTNFTGPSAPFSLRVWRGAEAGMAEVNAQGGVRGGMKIEFFKVDNRSETQTALTEYRRACANQEIPIYWAAVSSKDIDALYEVAKDCSMATFASTSGSHWIHPDPGKWVYRYLPVPTQVLPVQYQKLKAEFNVKTAALAIESDNNFAVFNAKIAKEILEKLGVKIVVEVDSKLHETNFASQVSAIRAARPDIIILSLNTDSGGRLTRQIRERGITVPISDTGYTVVGRDYWENSQGTGIGAIGSSIYASSDPRPIVQDWIKKWRAATNNPTTDPDPYETSTYDAVLVLAKILNNAKSLSRQDVADAFMTINSMETISGTISYRKQDLPDVFRSEPILVKLGENGRLERWGAPPAMR
ncbi:MAG: ABC transporter substrate-binding protein [Alphaproteobacteria bacterium]|nr:ABC transporter substrate-binding protein [Alphaproteobacteria bacterium]